MNDWVPVVLAILLPVVAIGTLGFIIIMANKQTTVFQRDAAGNIVSITTV